MKLPIEIRRAVNRQAHAAGAAYAEQTKRRLLAELERRLADGASIAEIRAHLGGGRGKSLEVSPL